MHVPAEPRKHLRFVVLVGVAFTYCALVAALSGPGFASFDTAYQWWMGRHAAVSTLWPPTYVVTFAWFDALSPYLDAPTVWFCVNLTSISAASMVIGYLRSRSVAGAVAIFLALAASPVSWLLLPHIWSDVALVAVLLMSVACLLTLSAQRTNKQARTVLRCVSLMGLFVAIGIRHNAMLAVLPLAGLWCHIALRSFWIANTRPLRTNVALIGGLLITFIFTVAHLGFSRALATERSDTWAITAIWDLQALSVATGRVLIPPLISPNTDIADLRASYDPSNAVALYSRSKATWANSTTGLSGQQTTDLATAWLSAVQTAPAAYFSHRARVTALILGIEQRDNSTRRVIVTGTRVEPGQTPFRDNPIRTFWWSSGADTWRRIAEHVTGSPWGSPQATLLVSLLAVLLSTGLRAFRRSRNQSINALKPGKTNTNASTTSDLPLTDDSLAFAGACLISGALYFTGVFVAAPSADMRYSFWPVVAAVLTAVYICTTRPPSEDSESAADITNPAS